jgi:malate synthase
MTGTPITPSHYDMLLGEVIAKIQGEVGADRYSNGHFRTAAHMFTEMVKSPDLDDFLTLPAYELLA